MEEIAADDPRTLGRYRVVSRLGNGGLGRVLLGVDDAGRRVALKVVHPQLAALPGFRERFRREVQLAATAPPWFTAALLDADPDGDPPWVATAYVEAPSLHAYVSANGPLGRAGTLALAVRMADGLVALHGAGIVHRDLKPSNVLLAEDGPCLIDGGFSRTVDPMLAAQAGHVVATPEYMTPEEIAGLDVGPAGDMFCLGSLIGYAATGRSPFAADSVPGVLHRVAQAEPNLGPLDGPLRDAVMACLVKDPAARPTAARLRDLLRPLEKPDPAAAAVPAPTMAVPMATPMPVPGTPAPAAPTPSPPAPASPVPSVPTQTGPTQAGPPQPVPAQGMPAPAVPAAAMTAPGMAPPGPPVPAAAWAAGPGVTGPAAAPSVASPTVPSPRVGGPTGAGRRGIGSTVPGLPAVVPVGRPGPPTAAGPRPPARPPVGAPDAPPRRNWKVIAAIVVAAVAGAGIALTAVLLLTGPGSEPDPAAAGPATTAPAPADSAGSPTSTAPGAEAPVIDAETDHRFGTGSAQFATPSGNIACRMSTGEVRCDVVQRTWQLPPTPSSCTQAFGTGTILSGSGQGQLSCVGDTVADPSLAKLAYGESVRFGDVVCASKESGMRCENPQTGHGFAVARASYNLF